MSLLRTIEPENANGVVADIYDNASNVFKKVPNVIKFYSVNPHWQTKLMEYLGYYSQHPKYSVILTAYIRLLVSVQLKCEYCIKFNSAILIHEGVKHTDLLTAMDNPENVELPDNEKAILLYALKVVADPHNRTENEVNELRNLGWDDSEIFDLVYHATNHSGFVKLLDAFKVEVDY
jgi:alkylhydroperoxidase family enzyme